MFGDAFPNGRFEYATKPPGAFYANVRRGGIALFFMGPVAGDISRDEKTVSLRVAAGAKRFTWPRCSRRPRKTRG